MEDQITPQGDDEWDVNAPTPNFKGASKNFPDLSYPCGVFQNTRQKERVNGQLEPVLRAIFPSGNIGEANSSVKVGAIASAMYKGRRIWKFYRDLTSEELDSMKYDRLSDANKEDKADTDTESKTKTPKTPKTKADTESKDNTPEGGNE